MFFRILIALLLLCGLYALFQIYAAHSEAKSLSSPLAEFTVRGEGNQPGITIVEFLNYDCYPCKDAHLVALEYIKHNPDARYVVRPVPAGNDSAEQAALYALAAGLQGRFWEMDRALSEYKGPLDEKFYRESAALYEIDFEEMAEQAQGNIVTDYAKDNVGAVQKLGLQTTPAFLIGKTLYQLDKPLTLHELIRMVETEKHR
ncbi:MAG: thioredoxin domain-containing protein [Micavibrio sp.]